MAKDILMNPNHQSSHNLSKPVILQVEDLHTSFKSFEGEVKAVNGVNLELRKNSILCLVGESGSGKSVTALSILNLIYSPGRIDKGKILFNGKNLFSLSENELRQIRGKEISMIFQDPTSALNPLLNVGSHMEEMFMAHGNTDKKSIKERSIDLLRQMDLPNPEHILKQHPFQLSGGMAQRVMIAMAMVWDPPVLIADEITSSLDVTLQADILDRIRRLRDYNHSSILLITHDMGVVAQVADHVAVMYAGSVVEQAPTIDLFKNPKHPYTSALLQTLPRLDGPKRRLNPIRGAPPTMIDLPDKCAFLDRCFKATSECRLNTRPRLLEADQDHMVACYNPIINT